MLKLTTKVSGPRDLILPVTCPCDRKVRINARTAKPGSVVECSGCGAKFQLTGDDPRKLQAAVDDLRKALGRLGR